MGGSIRNIAFPHRFASPPSPENEGILHYLKLPCQYGVAGTALFFLLLTQFMPSSSYPIRSELKTAVYQALIDYKEKRPVWETSLRARMRWENTVCTEFIVQKTDSCFWEKKSEVGRLATVAELSETQLE